MKKLILAVSLLAAFGASAHEATYNITTTWYEPQTQPRNTIFEGSFVYDEHSKTVTELKGLLSESMTRLDANNTMVWLPLNYQLQSWYDASLGGTFAAVFKNNSTATFMGDVWKPDDALAVGSVYAGFPVKSANAGNAYALIFVPDEPTMALTQAQIDHLAYADCTPTSPMGMMMGGGMMGAVCMTGIAESVYGMAGTMDGYPLSQTITLAPAVPEPGTYAMLLAGIGLMGLKLRRRQA